MNAQEPPCCSVCAKPTTQKCSACASATFCSRRCQTLLWPTHKVLCGRDPTRFYLPPLKVDELARLIEVKDRPIGGPSLSEMLFKWAGDDPSAATEEVFWYIAATEPDANSVVPLDYHLHYLFVAYYTLENARRFAQDVDDALAAAARSPWQTFAYKLVPLRLCYSRSRNNAALEAYGVGEAAADSWSIFAELNSFLRHDLAHATLLFQASRPEPRIEMREVLTLRGRAVERCIRDARRAPLSEAVQAALVAHYRLERESVRAKLEALDET